MAFEQTLDVDATEVTFPGFVLGGTASLLNVEVEVAAAGGTMTSFTLQLQDHADGEWYDYLSDADFDSAVLSNLLFASTTGPHQVAAGNRAHFHARINAAYAVRFRATKDAGGDVTIRGTRGGRFR